MALGHVESRAWAFAFLHEVEDLHDVLVVDLVDGARLLEEAPHEAHIMRVLRPQNLERYLAAQPDVARLEDAAHGAFAQQPLKLVVAAAGCAAPGHELHRGTNVAPPPAPHRPGVGATVVGQPGSHSEALPRSHHQRVLPPSTEPGLWAGDEPRASRKREPGPPQLFGVPLPRVEVDGDAHEQEGPARACVAVWNQALPGTGLEAKVKALRPAERRCMVAWMNETCVRAFERMYDQASKAGVEMLAYRKYRKTARPAAEEFTREACEGIPETPEQRRLLEQLRAAFRKSLKE